MAHRRDPLHRRSKAYNHLRTILVEAGKTFLHSTGDYKEEQFNAIEQLQSEISKCKSLYGPRMVAHALIEFGLQSFDKDAQRFNHSSENRATLQQQA